MERKDLVEGLILILLTIWKCMFRGISFLDIWYRTRIYRKEFCALEDEDGV